MPKVNLSYDEFKEVLKGEKLPAAIINLDALDHNMKIFFAGVRGSGKTMRVATKSVRVPFILDHIKSSDKENSLKGYMGYAVDEAAFLAELGYDDILVAYPSVQPCDLEIMANLETRGKNAKYVVDCEDHLDAMGAAGRKAGVTIKAVVELNVAYEAMDGKFYFGVRRSPVRSSGDVLRLIRYAERIGGVKVTGIMAYEAQVAGLNDSSPYTKMLNPLKKWIKKNSVPDVMERRGEVWHALEREGIKLELVNGGGSGSIYTTSADPAVTEVTIGSGLYTSHLFRYYRDIAWLPAAFFAIQITRRPKAGMIACQGGGYIASGGAGLDRLPMPYSPDGLKMLGMEGAGEVQTPLEVSRETPPLSIGDPVIWQHAKAGELMERFNEVLIVSDGKIVNRVPTYRGMGKCFV